MSHWVPGIATHASAGMRSIDPSGHLCCHLLLQELARAKPGSCLAVARRWQLAPRIWHLLNSRATLTGLQPLPTSQETLDALQRPDKASGFPWRAAAAGV